MFRKNIIYANDTVKGNKMMNTKENIEHKEYGNKGKRSYEMTCDFEKTKKLKV